MQNQIFTILRDAGKLWGEKKASRLAAALTYHALFSLAPLFIVITAIAGLVIGEETASGEINYFIDSVLGNGTAEDLPFIITNSLDFTTSFWATVIGLIALIFGASNLFYQLQDAFNTVWGTPNTDEGTIEGIIKSRIKAMGVVVLNGLFLIFLFALFAVLSALTQFARLPRFAGVSTFQVVTFLTNIIISVVVIGWFYKVLPKSKIKWGDVWPGAIAATFLLTLLNRLIGVYFRWSAVSTLYGAAGSLVLVLLWAYYAMQILLFGIAVSKVYAQRNSSSFSVP